MQTFLYRLFIGFSLLLYRHRTVPPTTRIFPYLYESIWMIMQITENYTKSMESACTLTKTWKCLSVVIGSSSESTASSVNCYS